MSKINRNHLIFSSKNFKEGEQLLSLTYFTLILDVQSNFYKMQKHLFWYCARLLCNTPGIVCLYDVCIIYLGLDWFCFVASEVDQVSALQKESLLDWISKLRIWWYTYCRKTKVVQAMIAMNELCFKNAGA